MANTYLDVGPDSNSVTIDNAELQVEISASDGDTIGVAGTTAHDGAGGSVNPVATGGYASTAVPTAVSTATDVTRDWVDFYGRPVIQPGVPVGTELSFTKQYTSQQTGDAMITPTSGKKLVITYYQIQVGGTTAGTVQLWLGASGDTTYTRGTDRAIFDGEFAPSATLKPGVVQTKESGWPAAAVDHVLRVTTSAAINPITITVWYYEL